MTSTTCRNLSKVNVHEWEYCIVLCGLKAHDPVTLLPGLETTWKSHVHHFLELQHRRKVEYKCNMLCTVQQRVLGVGKKLCWMVSAFSFHALVSCAVQKLKIDAYKKGDIICNCRLMATSVMSTAGCLTTTSYPGEWEVGFCLLVVLLPNPDAFWSVRLLQGSGYNHIQYTARKEFCTWFLCVCLVLPVQLWMNHPSPIPSYSVLWTPLGL